MNAIELVEPIEGMCSDLLNDVLDNRIDQTMQESASAIAPRIVPIGLALEILERARLLEQIRYKPDRSGFDPREHVGVDLYRRVLAYAPNLAKFTPRDPS